MSATQSNGLTQPYGGPTWPLPAETPLPPGYSVYTEYVALLTQTGTNAPVATVIYNNLTEEDDDIVWARTSAGTYTATKTGLFTANKTYLMKNLGVYELTGYSCGFRRTSANALQLATVATATSTGTDDKLLDTLVVIRVYS